METLDATIISAIISGVISYIVPVLLSGLRKKIEKKSTFPWAKWIIAHVIGGGLAGAISFAAVGNAMNNVLTWAVFGVSLGIMQWIALLRYIPVRNLWAVASTIGWSLFAHLNLVYFTRPLNWFVGGILVGILQWFCLVGRARKAEWWILTNGIAWMSAGFLGTYVMSAIHGTADDPMLASIIGWAVIGLLGGLILGISMKNMSKINEADA